MKRVADDEVEDDDHDERECGEAPVGQCLGRLLRLVEDVLSVALALRIERPLPIADPPPRDEKVEHSTDDAEHGSRPCGRAEEGGRDDVLDLRCAGDGDHTVGENTHPEKSRQEFFWNIRLSEKDCRKGVHNEGNDEYRESAVGENAAANENSEHRLVLPECLYNLIRDGSGKPTLFHDLGENGPKKEDGIVGLDVFRRLGHVDFAVDRHEGVSATERGDDGKERRDEDDGVAAVGEEHEQDEADEDHGDVHAGLPFHKRGLLQASCNSPTIISNVMCPPRSGASHYTKYIRRSQICAFSLMYLRALIAYSSGFAFAGSCSASTMYQPS